MNVPKTRNCLYKCHFTCIRSKAVLLLLLWLLILGWNNALIIKIQSSSSLYVFENFNNLLFLLFPIIGLIMDIWIGRIKMIMYCVYTCLIALILSLVSYVMDFIHKRNQVCIWLTVITYTIPFAIYRANVVPVYIDQMIGSSADDLSAVIYFHILTLIFPAMVVECAKLLITNDSHLFTIQLSTLLVTVYAIPFSHYQSNHTLDAIPQITNPIKSIVRVLNYARKHKYPRKRSALTYWEEDYPSRLDLGKEKYGGPFSEEEVEDVKTVLRMFPLFICVIGYFLSFNEKSVISKHFPSTMQYRELTVILINYGSICILILLHQFVIHPFFQKYIPSMLKRISLGLFFSLLSSVFFLVAVLMESKGDLMECPFSENSSNITVSMYMNIPSTFWIILPLILNGVSYFLIVITSLEFTVAQSPSPMRGLMVGLWYSLLGIGSLLDINVRYIFTITSSTFGCGFYYFLFKSVCVFLILIVFLILAKFYKLRTRNPVINFHQIAEDHVIRYIEQSEQFWGQGNRQYGTT